MNVSVESRTIDVSESTTQKSIDDPEPRGELREWTLKSLQDLSMVQTTLYTSVVGDAFSSNIRNGRAVCPQFYLALANVKRLREAGKQSFNSIAGTHTDLKVLLQGTIQPDEGQASRRPTRDRGFCRGRVGHDSSQPFRSIIC